MKGSHGKNLNTPSVRDAERADNAGLASNSGLKQHLSNGSRLLRQRIAAGFEAYYQQLISLRVYPRDRIDLAQPKQGDESLGAPE